MQSSLTLLIWTSILAFSFPLLVGVHLSKSELDKVANFPNEVRSLRFRRQLIIDPQPFNPLLTNRVLNVPIPTHIGFFPGGGQPRDQCERDEVLMEDGTCQNLLTPGNCNSQEIVLFDPETNSGFCAPRVCPPDRVFLAATQLCHDPKDSAVCPPGRELYYSAYGTAVCMCPDGTIEGDDDLDDDVCEPILGTTPQCPAGQADYSSDYGSSTSYYHSSRSYRSYNTNMMKVFWLKDFNSPPQCLPDPCNGANTQRKPDTLPFIPNEFGKCFQLGQTAGACPYGKIYVLNLEQVRGECTTLDDAGYNIFDQKTLYHLKKMFGPTITENNAPAIQQMMGYGNVSQGSTGMYGTSSPTGGINTNTIQPISSYQTHSSNTIIPVKNTEYQQNLITTPDNAKVGSSHQSPHQNNKIQQPHHHHIIIGANGFSSSKKPRPHPSSNKNILGQVSPAPQNLISQPRPQSFILPNTQKPFISPSPINHINSQISFNQQSKTTSYPTQNHVTPNNNPFINHNTKGSISRPVSTSGISNTQQPSHGTSQNKEICTFIQNPNGQGGKKVCQPVGGFNSIEAQHNPNNQGSVTGSRPISNAQQPSHGANQGKEICTFVQNPNGQGGKKVCQTIRPGPFNSLEAQGQGQFNSPEIFSNQSPLSFEMRGRAVNPDTYGFRLGKSFGFQNPPQPGLLTHHVTVFPNGEIVTHLRPALRHGRSANNQQENRKDKGKVLSRKRRNVLPHASPTNVFETRLLSCRPGAARDLNGKCRTKVLPPRIPMRRGVRAAPPVPPTPTCPRGMAFNIRRMCVPANTAQNSLIAFNLG